jgi:hypothetical protein
MSDDSRTWGAGVGERYKVGAAAEAGWNDDDACWTYTLPFAFPYLGRAYTSVKVCSNGYIDMVTAGGGGATADYFNCAEGLAANLRIAGLWADLVTNGAAQTGEDIYVTVDGTSSVTFRWRGESYYDAAPVNFEITLTAGGGVVMRYGEGNAGVYPTIGIGGGDGTHVALSAHDGSAALANADALTWRSQLPDELALDFGTGAISGLALVYGTYPVDFVVTDTAGASAWRTLVIEISQGSLPATTTTTTVSTTTTTTTEPTTTTTTSTTTSTTSTTTTTLPLHITTESLPDGAGGMAYSATLGAAGGLPPYTWSTGVREISAGPTPLSIGTAQGWHGDDRSWSYSLPFSFPYCGKTYSSVWVCSNGYLDLMNGAADCQNSPSGLASNVRIAGFWFDLMTNGSGQTDEDIYVDTDGATYVTFRWRAETFSMGNAVNFEIVLRSVGAVEFHYGAGNANVAPTIGMSAGDGVHYALSVLDGATDLPFASDAAWGSQLPDGLYLDPATGALSGVPQVSGTFGVDICVRDTAGNVDWRTFELVIQQGELPEPLGLWLPAGFMLLSQAQVAVGDVQWEFRMQKASGNNADGWATLSPHSEQVFLGESPHVAIKAVPLRTGVTIERYEIVPCALNAAFVHDAGLSERGVEVWIDFLRRSWDLDARTSFSVRAYTQSADPDVPAHYEESFSFLVASVSLEVRRLDQSEEQTPSNTIAAGGMDSPVHKAKVRTLTDPHLDRPQGGIHFFPCPGNPKAPTFVGGVVTSGDTVGISSLEYKGPTGQPVTVSYGVQQVWDGSVAGTPYSPYGGRTPITFTATMPTLDGDIGIPGHQISFTVTKVVGRKWNANDNSYHPWVAARPDFFSQQEIQAGYPDPATIRELLPDLSAYVGVSRAIVTTEVNGKAKAEVTVNCPAGKPRPWIVDESVTVAAKDVDIRWPQSGGGSDHPIRALTLGAIGVAIEGDADDDGDIDAHDTVAKATRPVILDSKGRSKQTVLLRYVTGPQLTTVRLTKRGDGRIRVTSQSGTVLLGPDDGESPELKNLLDGSPANIYVTGVANGDACLGLHIACQTVTVVDSLDVRVVCGEMTFRRGSNALAKLLGCDVTHGGFDLGSGAVIDLGGAGVQSVSYTDFWRKAVPSGPRRRIWFTRGNFMAGRIWEKLYDNLRGGEIDNPTSPRPWNLFSSAEDYRTANCLEWSHRQWLAAIQGVRRELASPQHIARFEQEYYAQGKTVPLAEPVVLSTAERSFDDGGLAKADAEVRVLVAAADRLGAKDDMTNAWDNQGECSPAIYWSGYQGVPNNQVPWYVKVTPLVCKYTLSTMTPSSFLSARRFEGVEP